MTEHTYFGLEVVNGRGVRSTDIACLPFADFWSQSLVGSTQALDHSNGEWLVYLHDWENFCELFIRTGQYRDTKDAAHSVWRYWEDDFTPKTYFGLEIVEGGLVRIADIAWLPFYEFWRDSTAQAGKGRTRNPHSQHIPLSEWEEFARSFIDTGHF